MPERPTVLAINCGSSSLKFGLYEMREGGPQVVLEGEAEEIGHPEGSFWTEQAGAAREDKKVAMPDFLAAGKLISGTLEKGAPRPEAVGHRIVHGGPNLTEHCLYRDEVRRDLDGAAEFAPLHVPPALKTLDAFRAQFPDAKHVLCFDSAFHRTMPDESATLPLPAEIRRAGIRKYGFHGLVLEGIVAELQPVPQRLIVAHLGNGCSVTAIRDGGSVDTTMSFTPNAGMMMGTRCGNLDPGVLTWLVRHREMSADELDKTLNKNSGLLGVSETTSDVRELMAKRSEDRKADLALRMFVQQAQQAMASMAAVLGGADAMVFTGGIGEHAKELRDQILSGLGFIGCRRVEVMKAREDERIAAIAMQFL